MRHYLQWFRDRGNGQIAADNFPNAVQGIWNTFPVARVELSGWNDSLPWHELLNRFNVNAMTWHDASVNEDWKKLTEIKLSF